MTANGTYVDVSDGSGQTGETFNIGSPWTLVQERFDLANTYASDSYETTNEYIDTMTNLLGTLTVPDAGDIENIDVPSVTFLEYLKRPHVGDVNYDENWPVNSVTLGDLADVPDISDISTPTITFTPPDWLTIDKPVLTEIPEPGDAPPLTDISVPAAPSVTLPDVPSIETVALPAVPNISLPVFDGKLPQEALTTPVGFSYHEDNYSSDVYTDVVEKILHDIQNGGTGLNATIEQEIFDRARSRQALEDEKLYTETEEYFAARGFDMPPGALQGALVEVGNQINRTTADLNRDISIDQAKRADENTKFVLDLGQKIEVMLRGFHNDQANRSLEASKIVAQVGIDLFNAQVTQYNAALDAYKTEAAVYEAKIKASLSEVEVFKAQIEGAKVSQEVQALLVDIYNSQLNAVETQYKIYATEMEGVNALARADASRIEAFRAATQAYIARLEGEKTKFDIYATEQNAEKVKADVYDSQVRGFLGEVEATKAEAEVAKSKADVVLQGNAILLDKFKSELEAYLAEIDLHGKKVNAQLGGFQAEVSAYSAETQAEGSYYDAKAKETEALIQQANLRLQKAVAEISAALDGYVKIKDLQITGTEGIMSVGAQLAASSMQAVNASASFGYSASENRDESWRHSDSLSESHSFEENPT